VLGFTLLGGGQDAGTAAAEREAAFRKAKGLYAAGEFEAARLQLDDKVSGGETDAEAYRLQAQAAEATADFDQAEQAYRASLRVDPEQPRVHQALATLLAKRGDLAAAIVEGEAAVQQDPRFAGAMLQLGDLYARAGRFADARSHYQRLLSLDAYGVDRAAVEKRLRAVEDR
jgi:tetratricopeptide (TPR) repeat protein